MTTDVCKLSGCYAQCYHVLSCLDVLSACSHLGLLISYQSSSSSFSPPADNSAFQFVIGRVEKNRGSDWSGDNLMDSLTALRASREMAVTWIYPPPPPVATREITFSATAGRKIWIFTMGLVKVSQASWIVDLSSFESTWAE